MFCRSCLGGLVLGEIRGRPLFTLRPMGKILLTMRPFLLVNRQLEFCGATLTAKEMTSGPLAIYLWRPDLGGGIHSRQPASPLSLVLFLIGLPHGASRPQRDGPLEE